MATKQEVAKPPIGAMSIPEHLRGTGGRGLEGFDSTDIETPRLSLLQPTSPQVTDFDNARPGMFWHNTMNEPVGDPKAGFIGIICYINKRAILWRQRPPVDVGGILARTDDMRVWNPSNVVFDDVKTKSGKTVVWKTRQSVAQSRLLEWGSADPTDPKSPPAATLMHEYVLYFPDYPHLPPAVFTFQRSSLMVSKKLIGRLSYSQVAMHGLQFRFGSDLVDNGGNKYYIPTFEQAGYVEDASVFAQCEVLHNTLKKSGLKVREEDAPDDETTIDADGPAY